VGVVGHDHETVQSALAFMRMKTTVKNNVSCAWRQNPTTVCVERGENGAIVFLEMRQVAAVRVFAEHLTAE
jgi:hypothetical protein